MAWLRGFERWLCHDGSIRYRMADIFCNTFMHTMTRVENLAL